MNNRTAIRVLQWLLPLLLAAGCGQEMASQPRVDQLERSPIDKNQSSSRELPAHIVPAAASTYAMAVQKHELPALSYNDRQPLDTGRRDGQLLDHLPAAVLNSRSYAELLRLGQKGYHIWCMPCHDSTGSGNGMVARRGFPFPPTLHSDRLRSMPVGYFFLRATRGGGSMPGFDDLISTEDRWAIAAYVRALQFSQYAPLDTLENSDRTKLEAAE